MPAYANTERNIARRTMKKSFFVIVAAMLLAASAAANTPGKRSVVLTWTDPETGVTFNVYRGTVAGVCSGTPTPYISGVTALTYTDTAVVSGTTYFYNVSAVKGGIEGPCSNAEAQITVPTSPLAPSNLQGTAQ
jgi:fibronectin type 3 domain-containing protein